MNKKNEKNFSDFDFIKIYCALNVLNEQSMIIENHKLEKELYKYYKKPEFKCLLKDIIKNKYNINQKEEYISLRETFDKAYMLGLMKCLANGEKSVIRIDEQQSENILAKYDSEYVDKMNLLFDQVKGRISFFLSTKSKETGKMLQKKRFDKFTK